ncbi:MAG: cytochrome c1 [Moritella sp.]|uniref:cytochrome c1 n=1 Tax=Moritella sp. TaxID=78556 RepID=UPI001DCF576A|nr:cytochrome c1 [Moritella sp.]NQZ49207.1 cytochrome c1 [Moritella sp.]
MKKLFIALLTLLPMAVFASGNAVHLDEANYDLRDKASLQNGAKIFMNYCSTCHSTQYQRYSRVADDLGIDRDVMSENLVFTGVKVGSLMLTAMPAESGAKWFGATPPDLTLEARLRGADWVYTYLRSFYIDETRPFGVNNVVFPSVGMPHVLEELQGTARLLEIKHNEEELDLPEGARIVKETEVVDANGVATGEILTSYLSPDGNGELSAEEFDEAMLDLVNFLVYSAEPNQLERQEMGFWVIGFLLILLVFTWFLNREYWRDIH